MRRFLKISSYIVIAAIFSVALSGCQSNTKTKDTKATNIIVWSFEDDDIWKPIKKSFEAKYKGYTLTYQKQTLDSGYENRVLNSILSNDGPDVWSMPNDWVYRQKDHLSSISPSSIGIDKYNDSLKKSVQFDNNVYALSSYSEPLEVYYNQKIFEKTLSDFNKSNSGTDLTAERDEAKKLLRGVPSTWTDFTKAANLLTQTDGAGSIEIAGAALGSEKVTNAKDILYLLMLENDTTIVSDDLKQAVFNLPVGTPTDLTDVPGLRALDFYTSFADESSENYTWNDSLGSDIDAFGNGKVAMIFGYSSLQNYLAQKYPDFSFRRAAMPQLTTDYSKTVDYARSNVLAVTKATTSQYKDKPATCWKLIDMVTNGGSTDQFNSALKVYNSKKATSSYSFDDRSSSSPDKVALTTAKSLIKGRYPVEFDRIIISAIANVRQGTQDSKTALDTAANSISDLLRKEGW